MKMGRRRTRAIIGSEIRFHPNFRGLDNRRYLRVRSVVWVAKRRGWVSPSSPSARVMCKSVIKSNERIPRKYSSWALMETMQLLLETMLVGELWMSREEENLIELWGVRRVTSQTQSDSLIKLGASTTKEARRCDDANCNWIPDPNPCDLIEPSKLSRPSGRASAEASTSISTSTPNNDHNKDAVQALKTKANAPPPTSPHPLLHSTQPAQPAHPRQSPTMELLLLENRDDGFVGCRTLCFACAGCIVAALVPSSSAGRRGLGL